MYFQDIYFSYQIFRHELTSHSRIIPTVASLPLAASHLSHVDDFSTQLQQQSPISLHPPRCTAETTVFIRSSVRQSHIHLVTSFPGSSYVSTGNLADRSHSTLTSDFASNPRSKEISIILVQLHLESLQVSYLFEISFQMQGTAKDPTQGSDCRPSHWW